MSIYDDKVVSLVFLIGLDFFESHNVILDEISLCFIGLSRVVSFL